MAHKKPAKKRKFYLTRFSIDVLSEEPMGEVSLTDLAYETVYRGACVGGVLTSTQKAVSAKLMAELLMDFGSDPSFFDLNKE